MTIPNGADGIDLGSYYNQVSVVGDGTVGKGTGITTLPDLTREYVEDLLKQMFVQDNPTIQNPLASVYNGLRQGVSLSLAVIEAITKKLLNLPDDTLFLSVEHAISELREMLNLDFLDSVASNLSGGGAEFPFDLPADLGGLSPFERWFRSVNAFLDFDPTDTSVDLAAAAQDFLQNILDTDFEIPDVNLPGVITAWQNMWNEWFNTGTPAGTPAEVAQVFESIRATVAGGYTLQTFTANDPAWTVPDELRRASEAYAVAFNGGGKGLHGYPLTLTTGSGPALVVRAGGIDGGYRNERIDPSTLEAALAVTVGAAATAEGAAGGESKIMNGALALVSSIAGRGDSAGLQGYSSSTSKPGSGAATPASSVANGGLGGSSATATGGAGGAASIASVTNVTGGAGGNGANGKYAELPLSGGGGGGAGGGADTSGFAQATGGLGGNGGFPGGGSGSGGHGQGFTSLGGNAGVPANGMCAIYWR